MWALLSLKIWLKEITDWCTLYGEWHKHPWFFQCCSFPKPLLERFWGLQYKKDITINECSKECCVSAEVSTRKGVWGSDEVAWFVHQEEGCTWLIIFSWRVTVSSISCSKFWKSLSWYSNQLPKVMEQMTFETALLTLRWGLKGFPGEGKANNQFSSCLHRKGEESTFIRRKRFNKWNERSWVGTFLEMVVFSGKEDLKLLQKSKHHWH